MEKQFKKSISINKSTVRMLTVLFDLPNYLCCYFTKKNEYTTN